jgi:hypothetical protein
VNVSPLLVEKRKSQIAYKKVFAAAAAAARLKASVQSNCEKHILLLLLLVLVLCAILLMYVVFLHTLTELAFARSEMGDDRSSSSSRDVCAFTRHMSHTLTEHQHACSSSGVIE